MKKRFLSILLTLILLLSVAPGESFSIVADADSSGDYTYTVSKRKATITDYNTSSGLKTIYIPSTLGGYPVVEIGKDAFVWCSAEKIIIPDSVTTIGDRAFSGCENLASVTIGNKVSSIGSSAFSCCKDLTSIIIPDSVTSIGQSAFGGCSDLTSVDMGTGVTNIGDYAFSCCSSLTSIKIPKAVKSIGNSAFEYCSNLKTLTYNAAKCTIGESAFLEADDNITKVTIGSSVKSIPEDAFFGFESLTSIKIPDSVTSVGSYAFSYCSSLTSITIPKSVKSIGNDAFLGCNQLKTLIYKAKKCTVGDDAFPGNITKATIKSGVKTIPKGLLENCNGLKKVVIPSGVTSIGSYAFSGCSALTSVTIPSGVTTIGDWAFSGCDFASIKLPSTVKKLGKAVFRECRNLKSIKLPAKLKTIDDETFYCCNELKSITIPKSVKDIESTVFFNCDNLKNIYYTGSEKDWNKISIVSTWNDHYLNNATMHYNCNAISIKKAKVSGIKNKTYTGKTLKQSVKVTLKNKTLKKGTDYTVSYKNNKKIGKATVIIKGKGDYKGSISKTFKINPKKVKSLKLKSSKANSLTVSWKKDSSVSGYQIQYATNKKFTKGENTVKVSSAKTVKKLLKSLKANKTYYVRIKAYKKVGKTTYYGAYCTAKKQKIKAPSKTVSKAESKTSAIKGTYTFYDYYPDTVSLTTLYFDGEGSVNYTYAFYSKEKQDTTQTIVKKGVKYYFAGLGMGPNYSYSVSNKRITIGGIVGSGDNKTTKKLSILSSKKLKVTYSDGNDFLKGSVFERS